MSENYVESTSESLTGANGTEWTTLRKAAVPMIQPQGYRGRVRSGCLTCRGRKVKCDEAHPICNNCKRLKRVCMYKASQREPRKSTNKTSLSSGAAISVAPSQPAQLISTKGLDEIALPPQSRIVEQPDLTILTLPRLDGYGRFSFESMQDSFLLPDRSISHVAEFLEDISRPQNEPFDPSQDKEYGTTSTAALISQDIKLTTTMDKLTARSIGLQPALMFFLESLDCPSITPYGSVNWQRMKYITIDLALNDTALRSVIVAVSALYKAQLYNLPLTNAPSLYKAARNAYEINLGDASARFDNIMATTFFLCLFEFQLDEPMQTLNEPRKDFLYRLEFWTQSDPRSELSLRLILWLLLLHSVSLRGGGKGLMSEEVANLLPSATPAESVNLHSPPNCIVDAPTQMFEVLSTPIFDFYFRLQLLSGEIAYMTHYHRSRYTGNDQEEVTRSLECIKVRLRALWESRPTLLKQSSADLTANFSPFISKNLAKSIRVCLAAYYTEFVEIDRVLGDPVANSTEAAQFRGEIRRIVDEEVEETMSENEFQKPMKLSPGYLRPLFLYAIECANADENDWAVRRLRQIKDPICRSDFFAAFGKALAEAQFRKERRVTSRYFCIWYFGQAPPPL